MNEILTYNEGFDRLGENYLFSEVRRRKAEFIARTGEVPIDMGVGDIARPLPRAVVRALVEASAEMGDNARFKGYPPETGYPFLKEAIAKFYLLCGISADESEIFIGEGAKSDAGGFSSLFAPCEILIPDPVYPVYPDSGILSGHKIKRLTGSKENNFLPMPDGLDKKPRLIWLCSPNNPTGAAYGVAQLEKWVEFALASGSVILFDGAYSAYRGEGVPPSVYAAKGADECAVEFMSFSKSAGFTGLRCSYVRIPRKIKVKGRPLAELWRRRQACTFNGVSYVIQRAAEAALSPEGQAECADAVAEYMRISRVLGDFLAKHTYVAGKNNAPYIFFETPRGMTSEAFFDLLLRECRIVGTPGSGFGKSGEGFFRLSCFVREPTALEALARLKKIF